MAGTEEYPGAAVPSEVRLTARVGSTESRPTGTRPHQRLRRGLFGLRWAGCAAGSEHNSFAQAVPSPWYAPPFSAHSAAVLITQRSSGVPGTGTQHAPCSNDEHTSWPQANPAPAG